MNNRTRQRRAACGVGAALLMGSGCRDLEPAPAELDDLLHYLFDKVEFGEDAQLAEALENLHVAVGGDTLEEMQDGLVSHLSVEAVAAVGITDRDPADASGVYMTRPIVCPYPDLLNIVTYQDQHELYVGVYDEHAREYTSSLDDFKSGATHELTWDTVYTGSLLGISYTANSQGYLRRVPDLGDGSMPFGDALFGRIVLGEPAEFAGNAGNHFDQDYQLEVFWPRDDIVLHMYAMWKDSKMAGFEDEGEATQVLMVNALRDWDDGTEQICAAGLPDDV